MIVRKYLSLRLFQPTGQGDGDWGFKVVVVGADVVVVAAAGVLVADVTAAVEVGSK
jgi:hypothetical protein